MEAPVSPGLAGTLLVLEMRYNLFLLKKGQTLLDYSSLLTLDPTLQIKSHDIGISLFTETKEPWLPLKRVHSLAFRGSSECVSCSPIATSSCVVYKQSKQSAVTLSPLFTVVTDLCRMRSLHKTKNWTALNESYERETRSSELQLKALQVLD